MDEVTILRESPAPMPPDAARLLDLLPGLVAYFGPDLIYRYANATYSTWRNLDPADIVGRSCREIVGETNYPLIAAQMARALAGERVMYEYEIFDRADARRVQGSYVPDIAPDGTVAGVVVLVTDISERADLRAQIAATETMFDDAFQAAPFGMAIAGVDARFQRVNQALATILGRPMEELVGMPFSDVTHPDDIAKDMRLFNQVLADRRDGYRIDKRYIHATGAIVDIRLSVSVVRDDTRAVVKFLAQVEDVTEANRAAHAAQEASTRLSLALEAIRGGFWHMDLSTRQFEPSAPLLRFVHGPDGPDGTDGDMAAPAADALGDYVAHIVAADRPRADLAALMEGRIDRQSAEYRLETQAGTRWMRCDRRLLRDAEGAPMRIVGVAIDISEERAQLLEWEKEAETDSLTGLLNRRGLARQLERPDGGGSRGLMAIDLDRFKAVNDRFGHAAGDAVLVEIAERLRALVRGGDLIARLGGDEFMVVLDRVDPAVLGQVAERTTAALCRPFAWHGAMLPIGASVGATLIRSGPDDIATAMEQADAALYAAKADGKGTWRMTATESQKSVSLQK